MKRSIALTAALFGIVSVHAATVVAQTAGSSTQSSYAKGTKSDRKAEKFVTKAGQGNLAEIKLGQLAQQQANSPEVKAYGQMLATDHQQANDRLRNVAGTIGANLPSQPSSKQQRTYDRMAKLRGASFDREFVRHSVSDHKKEIKEYKREAKARNQDLASYVNETLPSLQKHLDQANSLRSKVTALR